MPTPNPLVIDDLCRQYRRVSRADVLACWNAASRHWFEIDPAVLANEPPELTAARTLFVHAQLERDDREAAANHQLAMWILVGAYARRK